MGRVSVVTATKNREAFLEQALESLSNQTFNDCEVVIVNDGGRSVAEMTRRWADKLTINLIERPTSKGPAAARNLALRESSGEYVAFLDDDDIYLPDHLGDAVHILDANSADLVYSGVLVSPERLTALPEHKAGAVYVNNGFSPRFLLVACTIPMSGVVCRNPKNANAFFSENLFVCEDWEMWVRLHVKCGYRFHHLPNVSAIYHRVPDVQSASCNATAMVQGYKKFVTDWVAITSTYETPDRLVNLYRRYMALLHELCIGRISSGKRLSHFYYENFTERLLAAFNRGDEIPDIEKWIEGFISDD